MSVIPISQLEIAAQEQLIAELLHGGAVVDQYVELAHGVDEGVFSDRHCQIIYLAIKALWQAGGAVSLNSVANQLEISSKMATIGGFLELSRISDRAVTGAYVRTTAQQVIELHFKRKLQRLGENLAAQAQNGTDVFDLAESAMAEMQSVMERGAPDRTINLDDAIQRVDKELAAVRSGDRSLFVPTGISTLDEKLSGGFRQNSLVVVGARPSKGKSNIAFNLVANMSESCRIGLISAEMDSLSVTQRMLSLTGGFDDLSLSTGLLSHYEEQRYQMARRRLAGRSVWVNDEPHISIQRVEVLARKWHRERKMDLLFVDYLQLLSAHIPGRTRESEVASITKVLKRISREICTVVALAQLNRAVEGMPKLSDLRESGSIEQDADAVILLHSFDDDGSRQIPEGFGRYSGLESRDVLALLIEKNRRGKRKVIAFTHFDKATGRIAGLSTDKPAFQSSEPTPF